MLKKSNDIGVRMLWLADKLANIRSLARVYSEQGEAIWKKMNQSDPAMQRWYYQTIAETVELSLNKTGAFKELIKHINYIWPGTFDSDKAKYKKYREVSVEGCQLLGKGAKGDVYRYDEEIVIKVFNQNNTYRDVEREISLSRSAFILGMPTAISFGIVSVGDRYGAMFELVDSETVSQHISRAPGQVESYARIIAELARTIHSIKVSDDVFPPAADRIKSYINGGLAYENEALAKKCIKLIDQFPDTDTLIHGDFHTGNVFLQNGEPLLIDMDRISVGHPIIELSDLYYFYITLGEDDLAVVENFMGFSYQTAKQFLDAVLEYYLQTDDEKRIAEVKEKASFICCARMIRRLRWNGTPSEADRNRIEGYIERLEYLIRKYDTLAF